MWGCVRSRLLLALAALSGALALSAPSALAGDRSAADSEYVWVSPLAQRAVDAPRPAGRVPDAAAATGPALPFTGLSLLVPAALTSCLVGAGVALRRRRASGQ